MNLQMAEEKAAHERAINLLRADAAALADGFAKAIREGECDRNQTFARVRIILEVLHSLRTLKSQ